MTVLAVIRTHPTGAVYQPANTSNTLGLVAFGSVPTAVLYGTVITGTFTYCPSASKVAVTLVGHAAFAKLQLALLPPY